MATFKYDIVIVGGLPPNLETNRETCKSKWEVVSEGEDFTWPISISIDTLLI